MHSPSNEETNVPGPVPGVQTWERFSGAALYVAAPLACIAAVVAATYVHLGFLLSPPFVLGFLWLVLRRKSDFVDAHGRESISIVLVTMVLGCASVLLGYYAVFVVPLAAVFVVICFACGAWHASAGWLYKAPICCHLRG